MKICPRCQKTYTDEGLNFCLEDGTVLSETGAGEPLPQTVLFTEPPAAEQNRAFGAPPVGSGHLPRQSFPPPKKSSKTWLWAIGVLAVLILVCGGGFAGLLLLAGLSSDPAGTDFSERKDLVTDDRRSVQTFDMSNWRQETNEFARSEYRNREFILQTVDPSYFYVYVALEDFRTQNAAAQLTVRNINSRETTYGYGILFHSGTLPLIQDYAFLIDSQKQSYRVVKHLLKQELEVRGWTYFPAIKRGSAENLLEIRDEGDSIKCYVNGQLATTLTDELDSEDGVAGIYASNAPVAFTRLEIRR